MPTDYERLLKEAAKKQRELEREHAERLEQSKLEELAREKKRKEEEALWRERRVWEVEQREKAKQPTTTTTTAPKKPKSTFKTLMAEAKKINPEDLRLMKTSSSDDVPSGNKTTSSAMSTKDKTTKHTEMDSWRVKDQELAVKEEAIRREIKRLEYDVDTKKKELDRVRVQRRKLLEQNAPNGKSNSSLSSSSSSSSVQKPMKSNDRDRDRDRDRDIDRHREKERERERDRHRGASKISQSAPTSPHTKKRRHTSNEEDEYEEDEEEGRHKPRKPTHKTHRHHNSIDNANLFNDPDYIEQNTSSIIQSLFLRPGSKPREYVDEDDDLSDMEATAEDLRREEARSRKRAIEEDKREEELERQRLERLKQKRRQ